MKTAVIIIVAVAVLGGGAFFLLSGNKNNKNATTTPPPVSKQSSDSGASQPSAAQAQTLPMAADGTSAVSVSANDDVATPETITVQKGAKVTITFNVSEEGTYHGGLDFKNTDLGMDSGSIAPGKSGTLSFTADKSFDLTPYWYQSGVKKDYLVAVHVQ